MRNGVPLALGDAGPAAAPVTTLSWILFAGGGAILLLVLVMIGIAVAGPASLRRRLAGERMILGLGFWFPIVVLSVALVVGLAMTASLATSSSRPGELAVRVTGERWWWRINYAGFETANELVIPVGRPVRIELRSTNVLHSFWVPQLGGKRDMIPGKINHLVLQADRAGLYPGFFEEYCGGPHALMQFRVLALSPGDYALWEAAQQRGATPPATPAALAGQRRFAALGCGNCHAVRGTAAIGISGPDLTHLAVRNSIGAGVLPMSHDNLTRWTRETDRLKPNSNMPAYTHLPPAEAASVSDYLVSLR